jgi:hypothetical protein
MTVSIIVDFCYAEHHLMLSILNKHFILSVIMLNIVMLSVIMLSVVAPYFAHLCFHFVQVVLKIWNYIFRKLLFQIFSLFFLKKVFTSQAQFSFLHLFHFSLDLPPKNGRRHHFFEKKSFMMTQVKDLFTGRDTTTILI